MRSEVATAVHMKNKAFWNVPDYTAPHYRTSTEYEIVKKLTHNVQIIEDISSVTYDTN